MRASAVAGMQLPLCEHGMRPYQGRGAHMALCTGVAVGSTVVAVDRQLAMLLCWVHHSSVIRCPLRCGSVHPAGIQDIDELVAAFNVAEDANYTLFNYVNEVNTEVEALEDNIGRVRQEIDAYVAQVGCSTRRRARAGVFTSRTDRTFTMLDVRASPHPMAAITLHLVRYHLQARASEASASAAAGSTFMRSAAAEAKADAYERCLAGAAGVVEQLRGGIGSLFETAVSCRVTGELKPAVSHCCAAAATRKLHWVQVVSSRLLQQ